jgi:hypothetical protein
MFVARNIWMKLDEIEVVVFRLNPASSDGWPGE